jgi:hypothetical protein
LRSPRPWWRDEPAAIPRGRGLRAPQCRAAAELAVLAEGADDAAGILGSVALEDDALSAPALRRSHGPSRCRRREALEDELADIVPPRRTFRARAADLCDLRIACWQLVAAPSAPPLLSRAASSPLSICRHRASRHRLAGWWRGAAVRGQPHSHVAMLARARGVP